MTMTNAEKVVFDEQIDTCDGTVEVSKPGSYAVTLNGIPIGILVIDPPNPDYPRDKSGDEWIGAYFESGEQGNSPDEDGSYRINLTDREELMSKGMYINSPFTKRNQLREIQEKLNNQLIEIWESLPVSKRMELLKEFVTTYKDERRPLSEVTKAAYLTERRANYPLRYFHGLFRKFFAEKNQWPATIG